MRLRTCNALLYMRPLWVTVQAGHKARAVTRTKIARLPAWPTRKHKPRAASEKTVRSPGSCRLWQPGPPLAHLPALLPLLPCRLPQLAARPAAAAVAPRQRGSGCPAPPVCSAPAQLAATAWQCVEADGIADCRCAALVHCAPTFHARGSCNELEPTRQFGWPGAGGISDHERAAGIQSAKSCLFTCVRKQQMLPLPHGGTHASATWAPHCLFIAAKIVIMIPCKAAPAPGRSR